MDPPRLGYTVDRREERAALSQFARSRQIPSSGPWAVGARERGFVLAAVLLALLLIAALVAAILFAATEDTRVSGATAQRQLALFAAESAVELTIAGWSVSGSDSIRVGDTRSSVIEGFGAPVAVHVTRLQPTLYWIVADVRSLSSPYGGMKRIGVVVRVVITEGHSITIDRIPERGWSELF
ncbi:MAG: PilX N-terminal domain-containing pilus assembly protein [Gemmatimonadales bacterium]